MNEPNEATRRLKLMQRWHWVQAALAFAMALLLLVGDKASAALLGLAGAGVMLAWASAAGGAMSESDQRRFRRLALLVAVFSAGVLAIVAIR